MGKSVTLRRRLLSYFRSRTGAKERELVRAATGLEWEYVPNELEALLGEYRLIRTFQPRFNRRHRRLRRYAWIRMTPTLPPRLKATREPPPDGSRCFGPFPAPSRLPHTLAELERTLGLVEGPWARPPPVASGQLDLLQEGATVPGISEGEARERALRAARFLEGTDDGPLETLREQRAAAVARRGYELAARLRDREERLRELRDEVVTYARVLSRLSCVYLPPATADGAARGYLLSRGRVLLRFDVPETGMPDRDLERKIRSLVESSPAPPEAFSATGHEEAFLVARWFRARPGEWRHTSCVERFLGGSLRR